MSHYEKLWDMVKNMRGQSSMKNRLVKACALMLSVTVTFGSLTGCSGQDTSKETKDGQNSKVTVAPVQTDRDASVTAKKSDTLTVGYSQFSGKFSPFFALSSCDMDVADLTGVTLLGHDREGNEILNGIHGETKTYNGTDYKYTGIAKCEVSEEKGDVIYDFTLRDDITFSDGQILTADDVIFTLYVLCDPTYEGSSLIYSLPIKGIEDYRSEMDTLYNVIMEAGRDNTDFTYFTEEQQNEFWEAVDNAGIRFAQDIIDYCAEKNVDDLETYNNNEVLLAMAVNGYGKVKRDDTFKTSSGQVYTMLDDDVPTAEDFWKEMEANYSSFERLSDRETVNKDFFTCLEEELGDRIANFNIGIPEEDDADYIEGIEKTGEYSFRIILDSNDINAIYELGEMIVAPLHYYGSEDEYDYEEHKFGFSKGDLRSIKDKTSKPLGAGPYQFQNYENGVVTLQANESYWKGCPKTEKLLLKEIKEADKVAGIQDGALDISAISLSASVLFDIKKSNDNGELDGNTIALETFDNLGYGYIGLNAEAVKVGDDASSKQSKKLRKAFATLFAVYREEAIDTYYGGSASVIQYPISDISWAAPADGDEAYETAYSENVYGYNIYEESMTESEQYEAALEAAIGYLKGAGYTYDKESGKFTEAPEGAKLSYEILIAADGNGNHPVYSILTSVKEALSSIGIDLEIKDIASQNELINAVPTGNQEMWVAAWNASLDPELYQTYHSDNILGNGGMDSNYYYISDYKLDSKIMNAEVSDKRTYRKSLYKECFDIILDWGVEVPVYQRQNGIIISMERINSATVTTDMTAFWDWKDEIELLEMQ